MLLHLVNPGVHKSISFMDKMQRVKITPFESLQREASTKLPGRVNNVVSILADENGRPVLETGDTEAPAGWLGDALRNYSVVHLVHEKNKIGSQGVKHYVHNYNERRRITGLDMDMARVVSGESSALY